MLTAFYKNSFTLLENEIVLDLVTNKFNLFFFSPEGRQIVAVVAVVAVVAIVTIVTIVAIVAIVAIVV